MTDDLVNDARDRCGTVDYNTVFRNVFFRLMQSRNEFPFRLFSAPLIFRSLVKPPVQCVKVDLKDKNAVKGIGNYLIEGVSGTGKTSVCKELQRRGYYAINM